MRALLFLLLTMVTASAVGAVAPRRVAVSVDDLPWVEINRTDAGVMQSRHHRLLRALKGTHAIGFVNEDKLEVDGVVVDARRQMLADWIDAGMELGNHTWGHVGLHQTAIEAYEQAILDGERVTRPLLATHGQTLRWFRHPYLHAGRDDAVRDRLATFLAEHGYQMAPVTIDNGEWIFARAYLTLLEQGEQSRATALRRDYVDYMMEKFVYFEDRSRRLFGRDIDHVLLIHANALNADALPDLFQRLRQRGYQFISLEEALRDPAYASADSYRGGAGITWIHRWAMAQKLPREFYADEPQVPPAVLALAGVEGE